MSFLVISLSEEGALNLVSILAYLDIELTPVPPYNCDKNNGAERGGLTMENELRALIVEVLGVVTDTDLLDLVYKILLNSITEN